MILLYCGVSACGSVRVVSGLLVLLCCATAVLNHTAAVQSRQVDEARSWVISYRPLPLFCQVWRGQPARRLR